MRLVRFCLLAPFLFALLCRAALAQTSVFTSPLPTGVRLDGVGDTVELGSMPLNVVPALSGDKAAARVAYQDLFALWKQADSDLLLLQQAQSEYEHLKN